MQMHLDDGSIQRLLHGELATRDETAATLHLGCCAECRVRLSEAEREDERLLELLRGIDHPMPEVTAEAVAEHAREGVSTDVASGRDDSAPDKLAFDGVGGRQTTSRRIATLALARWAAGVALFLVAAGVAYAVPGSPVREWVNRVVLSTNGRTSRPPRSISVTPANPGSAGIAVTPSDRFTIRFATTQKKGNAMVSMTDGPDIAINALDGTALFSSETDRVTIDNSGSEGSYEIELPRGARWVEILVAGKRLLLKRGGQIVTHSAMKPGGRYVIPLAPAASR
jgi:hypothetical protein